MAGEHYQAFIKEAFVDPIRSVLIVDDDYPTYDEILEEDRSTNNGKTWFNDRKRIRQAIKKFRLRNPPLLVDIHDGTNVGVDSEGPSHLYQSDLLVLDYELDKSNSNDGTRAIGILRSLTANNHFNMVVVYTNGNLDAVFDDTRWGLIKPSSGLLSDEDTRKAEELVVEGEDTSRGFTTRLSESIAAEQYFDSRLHASDYLQTMAGKQAPYAAFSVACDDQGWNSEQRELVLKYLLQKIEQKHLSAMHKEASDEDPRWSIGSTRWFKCNSAFVAFSEKNDDDDLLADLQKALFDWCPQPSRLFLAKLRAVMDEYGVTAQDQALTSRHALAHWYYRLLRADDQNRRWHIAETVSRHSDSLMGAISPHVEKFADRLIEAENPSANAAQAAQISGNHFAVDFGEPESKKRAALEHNAFVCSKDPEGWHLTTGHVFSMRGEYWLCLSPACDMVPSQISELSVATYGNHLPFLSVKLQEFDTKKLPSDIQSNRYLFLRLNGTVEGFRFNGQKGGSSPHWYTLYAENRGVFSGNDFRFKVRRTEQGKTRLISKRHDAQVISQLRYEYALNLTQQLGGFLMRIGLDFSDQRMGG